ncbi:hypothetical protein IMZ48_19235, partial [Candidatus Bathyarchaeota archaeon]|nr:hypothetical protein [Candidatus Bathyarchaeota archaeon]
MPFHRFLLAQLHVDSLKDKTSVTEVRTALEQLQRQRQGALLGEDKQDVLSLAYDQAMERIEYQMRGLRTLATRVLSWITCAKRPLTATELRHALAVKEGDRELDECNLRDISEMVSVCAGLVTVDEQSNTIRLVHYTAQEYFKETRNRWFEDADLDMANTCATYLSFDKFDDCGALTIGHGSYPVNKDEDEAHQHNAISSRDMELGARLRANPFYDYAARNWGH